MGWLDAERKTWRDRLVGFWLRVCLTSLAVLIAGFVLGGALLNDNPGLAVFPAGLEDVGFRGGGII